MLKNWSLKKGFVIALMFIGSSVNASMGTEAGNGGDFREMQFISLGYEAYDLMQELNKKDTLPSEIDLNKYSAMLRVLKVEFSENVTLNAQKRSAVNYPSQSYVIADRKEWDQYKNNHEQKLQMVLHETLPIIGVMDTDYRVSAPLMKEFRRRDYLNRLANTQRVSKQDPVLLLDEHWSSNKEGFPLEEAERLCENKKEEFEEKYFYVYCEFLEKTWQETARSIVPVLIEETHYDSKGRVVRETKREAHQPIAVSNEWQTYGLRAYGWASLGTAPWKIVASSLRLGGGQIEQTFPTEREAYRTCRDRLRYSQSMKYYRAICRSPRLKDGSGYYYEIVTQNPRVQ